MIDSFLDEPDESITGCGLCRRRHKTHLATALGVTAARHGHRVLFATATDWVTRLTEAHRAGKLPQELTRLRRYGLIIVDLCRARDYAEAFAMELAAA